MSESHVDILSIVGIDHVTFYNSGEDVSLKDEDQKPAARVFRKGGKLVYRAEGAVDWYGEDRPQGH